MFPSPFNELTPVGSTFRQGVSMFTWSGQIVRPPAAFESYSEAGRKFMRGEIQITQLDLKELSGIPWSTV
jgi:hypothetical protein